MPQFAVIVSAVHPGSLRPTGVAKRCRRPSYRPADDRLARVMPDGSRH